MNGTTEFWPRAIAFVDMDAFFASIEQWDRPELRHRPIAVTNGLQGTCIITSSYEARVLGIHTGMRLKQARRFCPELVQCPARPQRYAAVSSAIMLALQDITPDVEVFSVDEAFLDITRCQRLWGRPEHIAHLIKQKVAETVPLPCSVGLSGDKTTAKYAGKQNKPGGLTIIPPWQARQRLQNVPVTELCGIGRGIGAFLARYGVHTCGDMQHLPIGILAKRLGNPGRRIWHMCQGTDPDKVETRVDAPKSMGHGKVMPPATCDSQVIQTYLLHMIEKLVARLRRNDMQARRFFIGLRVDDGWIGDKFKCPTVTNDSRPVIKLCRQMLHDHWHGEGVHGVQVTALDPRPARQQMEMFAVDTSRQDRVNKVMDAINERYGEFTLAPAQLLSRSSMPNVIAPAWKPYGHRQFIP
ncbi:MAG: DNA polymerase IV [Gammaproteobacteria bacterium]|nr:DNA polymerase IV [Gammaproteobacteria bacterium]